MKTQIAEPITGETYPALFVYIKIPGLVLLATTPTQGFWITPGDSIGIPSKSLNFDESKSFKRVTQPITITFMP